jgi:lipid A 3-O-deacylase
VIVAQLVNLRENSVRGFKRKRLVLRATARALSTALLLATFAAPAAAQIPAVDEVKLGFLAHDVGLFDQHIESGADVNFEVLFSAPGFLDVIGSPRPHLGGSVNTAGNTDQGYFGLTWGVTLTRDMFRSGDSLFANGSLGGAVQDGYTDSALPGRKALGTRALFRESLELGYQTTPVVNLSAYLAHVSNAHLARHNAGLTDAGMRVGFEF